MAIGERLKELRIKKGESLQQVADATDASKAHIWELESSRSRNPSLDLLRRLAEHFNTTVAYLISEPEGEEKSISFFGRNRHKFDGLDDEEFEIFERLLNRLTEDKGSR